MVREMTIEQLQQAIAEKRVYAIYDNRGPGSYGARHIKGAKLLPTSEVKPENLPADKNALLVFY